MLAMRLALVGCDESTAAAHAAAAAAAGPIAVVAVAHADGGTADAVAHRLGLPWHTPRFTDAPTMVTALVSPSGEEAIGLDAAVVGREGPPCADDAAALWAADIPVLFAAPTIDARIAAVDLLSRRFGATASRLGCFVAGDLGTSHVTFRRCVLDNVPFAGAATVPSRL